jgi:hypothetical protein
MKGEVGVGRKEIHGGKMWKFYIEGRMKGEEVAGRKEIHGEMGENRN